MRQEANPGTRFLVACLALVPVAGLTIVVKAHGGPASVWIAGYAILAGGFALGTAVALIGVRRHVVPQVRRDLLGASQRVAARVWRRES